MDLEWLLTFLLSLLYNKPEPQITECSTSLPTDIEEITHEWHAFAALSPKYDNNTKIECFTTDFVEINEYNFEMRSQIDVNATKEYSKSQGIFRSNKISILNLESNEISNRAIEILDWKGNEILIIYEKQKSYPRLGIFSLEREPSFDIIKLLQCLSPNHWKFFKLVDNQNCPTLQN